MRFAKQVKLNFRNSFHQVFVIYLNDTSPVVTPSILPRTSHTRLENSADGPVYEMRGKYCPIIGGIASDTISSRANNAGFPAWIYECGRQPNCPTGANLAFDSRPKI